MDKLSRIGEQQLPFIFMEVDMKDADKETLEKLRAEYLPGTRVKLIHMHDRYVELKPGELGTVKYVDDKGTIHIAWDSGHGLGAVYDEDEVALV